MTAPTQSHNTDSSFAFRHGAGDQVISLQPDLIRVRQHVSFQKFRNQILRPVYEFLHMLLVPPRFQLARLQPEPVLHFRGPDR